MSFGWIERLGSDGLKPETSHHGVEEDFEEVEVVSICRFHDLHPLDGDLVLGSIVLSLVGTPVDEELELLLDLVSDDLEHILAESFGVIRDLWLELDGVLVDPLDLLLVKCDLEVVGDDLEHK